MYNGIYYDKFNEKIHLWTDEVGDEPRYSIHKFKKYAFAETTNGEEITIDGRRCTKVHDWSDSSVKLGKIFEHDVLDTTRFIVDRYINSDDLPAKYCVEFIDIETIKGETGHSSTTDAADVVNAITVRYTGDDTYYCMVLNTNDTDNYANTRTDEDKTIVMGGIPTTVKLSTFSSESDLLLYYLDLHCKFKPNVLTGWNVSSFDVPYLYHRIRLILGNTQLKKLSPDAGIVRASYRDTRTYITIAGCAVLDYLELYKEYTFTEKPNYRLNTIATDVLGRGKVEYEGDLNYLYKTDIDKFILYNITDVELVYAMDQKLDFIAIGIGLAHKGHVDYENIFRPSLVIDGAVITFTKRNNLIATTNNSKKSESAEGAYVKIPKPDLYKWIYDLDLTSLYPMNIITLNISPEVKHATILNYEVDEITKNKPDKIFYLYSFEDKKEIELKGTDGLIKYVKEKGTSISSNGMLYNLDKKGVVPSILEMWFAERVEFTNLRSSCIKEKNNELAQYYDRKQHIQKILLNTVYGVLLLESFRFYDMDNGEAVTITGQSVIKWSMDIANLYYKTKTKNSEYVDHVIYCDTDSMMLPLLPLLEVMPEYSSKLTNEEIIQLSIPIINDIQEFVNKSYDVYSDRCHNVPVHRWNIKQEWIARRGFWSGNTTKDKVTAGNKSTRSFKGVKKRYALWLVNEKGNPINKLEVKGLEVVRSNFPKIFREFMSSILVSILNDVDKQDLTKSIREFYNKINECSMFDIMTPTGVNNIDKYEDSPGSIPIHVRSAINYNKLLKINNSTCTPIMSGDKIMWCYLRDNPYNFDTIALRGFDDDETVYQFVHTYIDKTQMFEKGLKDKLQNFWTSLNWGPIEMNALRNKFFI